jgi:DNA-binding response OmpR family regulator
MQTASQAQTVLVVDDEPLILDLLHTTLEDAGFAVVAASDDAQAFLALESNGAQDFVGLVTDVNLRCPRSGWDIAHRAREQKPGIPVIYLSGDSAHEWTVHGVPQSVMVTKPFAPAQVVVALATLINAPSSDT